MLVYWLNGNSENKKGDLLEIEGSVEAYETGTDVTDKQDLTFRYTTQIDG